MRNPAKRYQSSPLSQRQLRVGEEVRHILSGILARGESFIDEVESTPLTISDVRISADLKHAFVYVMPLGGNNKQEICKALNENKAKLRHYLAKNLSLRVVPQLRFELDAMYDQMSSLNTLLHSSHVAQDLTK